MSLESQIAGRAKEIHADGYPMSIGEVMSLYRDGDIEIHPEFQRIFRWNDEQKSRLIESILLGIPIPPIFVSQRDDGVWEVIDGVQRLSTVLQFVGVYREENRQLAEPLTLLATEYLSELENYRWEVSGTGKKVFTDAMRRDFKRAKLEFRIIRKESDENAKYDMFQRLNAGTRLSAQEARNCLLVMINRSLFGRITDMSKSKSFLRTCPISEQKEDEAYYQELVLRFFCQADYNGPDSELPEEFGEYLTSWMRAAAKPENVSKVDISLFDNTFNLLDVALGEDAFRPWDGTRHRGPFSISGFEFITSGVCANLNTWRDEEPSKLQSRVREIWGAGLFRQYSGTGVSPRRRVPRMVRRSREYFATGGNGK